MSAYKPDESFESNYVLLRQKEGRIYTDEIVAALPFVSVENNHYKEWKARSESYERLANYLGKKPSRLNILEVGCGNGWLSNRLAGINNNRVSGIDINLHELEQGTRVFGANPNLHFVHSDIFSLVNQPLKFDLIIFAASLQYFPSVAELMPAANGLLNKQGEIHVIDSPFYKNQDLQNAAGRTALYYEQLGFPEMTQFYFHHSLDSMKQVGFEIIYSPKTFWARLKGNVNPFYWLRFRLPAQ